MNGTEIHQEFLRIEREESAFDIRTDGIPVWERLRYDVSVIVRHALDQWEISRGNDTKSVSGITHALRMAISNTINQNPYLADPADILCYGYNRRNKKDDGYWWDPYFDPIFEDWDVTDYLYVENRHAGTPHSPVKTSQVRYLDLIYILTSIVEELGVATVELEPSVNRRLRELEYRFAETFGVELDLREQARSTLTRRKVLTPLYDRFLRQIDPEVVLLVMNYKKWTFIERCQKQGIPVIELQHGVISEHDYAYHYPGGEDGLCFPDYLFTWGSAWEPKVDLPITDDWVIPVGYPRLENERRKHAGIKSRNQVVFISQPDIGNRLSRVAEGLNSDPEVEADIVYKLHPSESISQYPSLDDSGMKVVGADGSDLYRLFAESRAQVGVFSTAIYEGLNFHLDTFVFDLPGTEFISELYTDGPAKLVHSESELKRGIIQGTFPVYEPNEYFKPNPVGNIEEEIMKIRKTPNI